MKRISFRELSGEEIKQIRQQVVRLKEMGKTGKEIEQLTGVGQSRVSEIWKAYQCNGEASLEVKKRGVQRILVPEEEAETREIIINRPPKEFGLPGDQWTMSNVRKYVWNTYKKSLTDRCALNYFSNSDFISTFKFFENIIGQTDRDSFFWINPILQEEITIWTRRMRS